MEQSNQQKHRGRWKLFAVILVCAAPLVASYFTYYVIKPEARTNYGDLLDPRAHPVPVLGTVGTDGKPVELDEYKGKWIMLKVDSASCADKCQHQLIAMRQLRLAQGKEKDRLERVWLVTDGSPIPEEFQQAFSGMHVLRVKPEAVQAWLPVEQNASVTDHLYMIDPLGNLMMRWPKDADPNRIKKDIAKLMKASRIG